MRTLRYAILAAFALTLVPAVASARPHVSVGVGIGFGGGYGGFGSSVGFGYSSGYRHGYFGGYYNGYCRPSYSYYAPAYSYCQQLRLFVRRPGDVLRPPGLLQLVLLHPALLRPRLQQLRLAQLLVELPRPRLRGPRLQPVRERPRLELFQPLWRFGRVQQLLPSVMVSIGNGKGAGRQFDAGGHGPA
jgi:hypothetical protein